MSPTSPLPAQRRFADRLPFPARRLALCAALAAALCGPAAATPAAAESLRAQHAALAPQLARNPFQRPLYLYSTETSDQLRGDVYAIVEHPFRTVDDALRTADQWCDVLILPFNVKQCRPVPLASGQKLELAIGRKYDQPLSDAHKVLFDYRLAQHDPGYLRVELGAREGPLGTHDYRIVFQAIPLDARRSFMHMSYSYGYGMAASLAMQAYLATAGRDKVGFSIVDRQPDGQPVYVDNMRGVVERNTMRYYLAIDAYLDSLAAPPPQRVERRLLDWFTATERYRRQLHEISQEEYLGMKRREIRRQEARTEAKAG